MKKIYLLVFALIAMLGFQSAFATNNALTSPAAPYIVGVTNSQGCGNTLTSSVPNACAGTVISLTCTAAGGTPYTFAWSANTGLVTSSGPSPKIVTVTLPASGPVTYVVTVTQSGGVSCTSSVNVTVDPLPTANAGLDTTVCGSVTFKTGGLPTATGGTAGYTYSWSATSGAVPAAVANPSVTIAAATPSTTYKVTVTDSKTCTASAQRVVTQKNVTIAPTASPTIVCPGTTVNLTANATGASGAETYNWSASVGANPVTPTTKNPTATPAVVTTYTAVVTDGTCTATGTVVVNIKSISIAPTASPTIVCPGTTVNLTANATGTSGAETYAWSASAGANPVTPTTKNPTATPAVVTTYTVVVTDGTCTATGTVVVNIKSISVAPTASPTTVCPGVTVNLTANPGGVSGAETYSWSASVGANPVTPTTNNPTCTPLVTTIYTVTVTDGTCTATNTVTVTVNTPPAPVLTFVKNPICLGDPATINTAAVGTASWSASTPAGGGTPAGNPGSVTPPTAGSYTYTVTITDGVGCTGSATSPSLVVNALPTALVTPATKTICVGSTYILGEVTTISATATSWVWSHPETSIASPAGNDILEHPTVKPPLGGPFTYVVTVTDANTCTATSSVAVTVTNGPTVTLLDGSTCAGVPYTLNPTATGGSGTYTSYNWNPTAPGANGMSADNIQNPVLNTPTTTTIYTVTVTDNLGCTGSKDALVKVNAAPVATATDNHPPAICSGTATDVSLTADIALSTFNWTSSVTSGTVTGNGSGSGTHIGETLTSAAGGVVKYTITPTGPAPNSCVGLPITINITVNPIPAAPVVRDTAYCQNAIPKQYPFMITSGATNPKWYDDAAGTVLSSPQPNLVSTSATGIFKEFVTETLAGCEGPTSKITITVNPIDNPAFSYSSGTYCKTGGGTESPVSVTTPGGTFSFLVNAGGGVINLASFNTATGSFDVLTSDVGTYRVKYTTNGTCFDTLSVLVKITNAFVADFNYTGPYCLNTANPNPVFTGGGSAGTFTTTPGLKFVTNLTTSSTGQIDLVNSMPGTYTVTNKIAASGSCPAISYSNTVTISGLPIVNKGTVKGICNGGSVQIGLPQSGTDTYSWSPTASFVAPSVGTDPNPTVAPTVKTKYTLVETDGNGCVNSDTVTVSVNPLPAKPTVANVSICKGNTATLTATAPVGGGITYQWYLGPAIAGATSAAYTTPVQNTAGVFTYDVEAISAAGCVGPKKTATLTVVAHDDSTWSYANGTYCRSGTNPCPVFGPTTVLGGQFSWVYVSGGPGPGHNLAISTNTGCINLAISDPGKYDVSYNTFAVGKQCPTIGKFTITITDAPDASFSYTPNTYCQYATPNPFPTFTTGSPGTFTEATGNLKFVANALTSSTGQVDLTFSAPGSYIVKNTIAASAITGCSQVIATTPITINPSPKAPIVKPIKYCLNAATVPLTPCGGGIGWAATMVGGVSSPACPTPANSPAGTYHFYADTTALGCTSTRSDLVVTINALPTAPVVTTPVNYCVGDPSAVSLVATATGGNTLNYYGPNSTVTVFPSPHIPSTAVVGTSTFPVDQTDANGCVSPQSTITVNINPIDDPSFFYGSHSYCIAAADPSAIPGGTQKAGGKYTISDPTVTIDPVTGKITLSTTTVGSSYTVTYTTNGTSGNCHASATWAISIIAAPTANFTYPPGQFCQLAGGTASVRITPGSSAFDGFMTFPTANTPPLGVMGAFPLDNPGTFTVRHTIPANLGNNGCPAVIFDTTITVNVLPAANAGTPVSPICSGTTVQLGAANVPTSSYSWSRVPAAFASTISNPTDVPTATTTSITYTYTVIETNTATTCSKSNTVNVIVNAMPNTPTVTGVNQVCEGGSTTLTASIINGRGTDQYNWYVVPVGGAPTAGGGNVNPFATGPLSGIAPNPNPYMVYVDATNGTCVGPRGTYSVNIVQYDDAAFVYNPNSYCKTSNTPTAAILNTPGTPGNFTSATLTVSNVDGSFNINTAGLGSHDVTFQSTGTCPSNSTQSVTITAAPNPQIAFDYKAYCKDVRTISLSTFNGGLASGSFSSTPTTIVNSSTGDVDLNNPANSYTITYTIPQDFNPGGCAAVSTNWPIEIRPYPVAAFTMPADGCSPQSPSIVATQGANLAGTTYDWTFSDGRAGQSGTTINPRFVYVNSNGTYTITITESTPSVANQEKVCSSTTSKNYHVFQQPDPYILVSNDIVTNLRPTANLIGDRNSGDFTTYQTYYWTYGDGSKQDTVNINTTSHEYPKPGDYTITLKVITTEGCDSTISKLLNVKEQTEVWIPDAFTPNGDGNNDTFGPRGVSIKQMEMYIYDRWGSLIYSTTELDKPWQGNAFNSSELAQQDVYVYKIIITDYRGTKLAPFIGRVTLVR